MKEKRLNAHLDRADHGVALESVVITFHHKVGPAPSNVIEYLALLANVLQDRLLRRVEANHHAVVSVRDPVALEVARLASDRDVDSRAIMLQTTPVLMVHPVVANE